MTATIIGKYDYGNCGMVPLILVPIPKPKLSNNGCNDFVGMPVVDVPGLYDILESDERWKSRHGHVMLVFSDGQRFGTWASTSGNDDRYLFS